MWQEEPEAHAFRGRCYLCEGTRFGIEESPNKLLNF
jgi:hypothetical protein